MSNDNGESGDSFKPALIAGLIVVSLWLTNLFYWIDEDNNVRGTFGDMFGGVNALFSGMAFVGVIYAIFLQRKEVALAKEEIEKTKKMLSDQQAHLETQNIFAMKQNFESTFFQLLRLFAELTESMDLMDNHKKITAKGKDVFPIFLKRLKQVYTNSRSNSQFKRQEEESVPVYDRFYSSNNHSAELGHYFRTLYNLIKFVHNSEVEDKKFYTNLIRAQLSDAEAALLFHNGLSKNGIEKFKPLLEQYGLLKNFQYRYEYGDDLVQKYSLRAFG